MSPQQDRYTSYNQPDQEGPGPVGYLAVVCAWAVPGLGHIMLGQKARGIIFMVTIHLLFAAGLFIGGIRVINPPDQPIWCYTQLFAGWPMLIARNYEANARNEIENLKKNYETEFEELRKVEEEKLKEKLDEKKLIDLRMKHHEAFIAKHALFHYDPKTQDMGSVYCGIAGMLNLLVIFDVLLRITGSTREEAGKKPAPKPSAEAAK